MGNFVDMKLLLVVFAVATVAFGAESAPKAQKTLNAFEKTLSSGKANVTVNDVDAMLAKMAEKKQEHHKVLHTHKVHVAKKSKVPPPPSLKKSDHSKKSHHKASKSSKSHSMKSAPHGHSEDSDLDLQNPWYQEYLDNMGHYFVMGSIFVVILVGAVQGTSFDGPHPHPDCSHDRALPGPARLFRDIGHARAASWQADVRDAGHVCNHRWLAHRPIAAPWRRVRPQGGGCQGGFLKNGHSMNLCVVRGLC